MRSAPFSGCQRKRNARAVAPVESHGKGPEGGGRGHLQVLGLWARGAARASVFKESCDPAYVARGLPSGLGSPPVVFWGGRGLGSPLWRTGQTGFRSGAPAGRFFSGWALTLTALDRWFEYFFSSEALHTGYRCV